MQRGPRSFLLGVIVGVLVGSAGLSVAALGYKGWERGGKQFQAGYVAGFMDMANLARNIQPGGFIDERYPLWPQAKVWHWHKAAADVYANPENQKYSMLSVMQMASDKLREQFGPAPTALERLSPRLKELFGKSRDEELAKRMQTTPPTGRISPPIPERPADKPKIWCKCAEMEKACPELAKEFAKRKPKKDDDEAPAPAPGEAPAPAPAPAPQNPPAAPENKGGSPQ